MMPPRDSVRKYLMNFWEHSTDSRVRVGDQIFVIDEVHQSDRSQVRLRSETGDSLSGWYFVQDLEWEPSVEEGHRILSSLGITNHGKYICYNGILRNIPTTVEEIYETLVEYRIDAMNLGYDLGSVF